MSIELPPWLVAIIDQCRAEFAECIDAADPLASIARVVDDCCDRMAVVLNGGGTYDPHSVAIAATVMLTVVAETLDTLTEGNPR